MMEKRIVSIIFLALLFVIPLASSIDTQIHIKTYPDYDVQVTPFIWQGSTFTELDRFREQSDEYGDTIFTLSSEVEEFNLAIFIKNKEGKTIIKEKEEGYVAGEPVYKELALEGFIFKYKPEIDLEEKIETNSTDPNKSKEIESEIDKIKEDAGTTGFAVFGEDGILSKKRLYYIIGVLVLAIIIFILIKMKKKSSSREIKEIKTKQAIGLQDEKDGKQKLIEEAEDKIKKAQEDIEKLKSNN